MDKCLVSKLKATVSNTDLPTFNKVFIDYTGNNPLGRVVNILIEPAAGKTVKLSFAKPFTIGGNDVTSAEITSRTICNGNNLGTEPIEKLITIENIYDVKRFSEYATTNTLVVVPSVSNGLESMLTYSPIEVFGGAFGDMTKLPDYCAGIKYLIYSPADMASQLDADNLTSMQQIHGSASTTTNPCLKLTETLGNNETINTIRTIRPIGSIVNLPVNTKAVFIGTSSLSGSIEDLVTKMRGKGRTSGAILLISYTSARNVTYNGTALRDQELPTYTTGQTIVTWTNDSISFTGTAPEELTDYLTDKSPNQWEPDDD